MRRATEVDDGLCAAGLISIHALREESDAGGPVDVRGLLISIHALREESDSSTTATSSAPSSFQSTLSVRRATDLAAERDTPFIFQSTLSVRRATLVSNPTLEALYISIHALREESDC